MKILIGSPARQDEVTFAEYIKSINNLWVPKSAEVDKYFILNDCPELKKYLNEGEYEELNTGDTYITDEETHHWNEDNINKMSVLRNRLIDKVLEGGYDYLFMVDTDVILHPRTLVQLLSQEKDLVANIYWTQTKPGGEGVWPNCWHYGQCVIENMNQWIVPGIYEVGGTGACFLMKREVFEKGVNYTPIPNLRCLIGEDRDFCIRAVCNGFKIYIDTNYPALHLYRPSVLERYMEIKYGGKQDGTT